MFHADSNSVRSASVDQRRMSMRIESFAPLTFCVVAVRLRIGPEPVWAVNPTAASIPAAATPSL